MKLSFILISAFFSILLYQNCAQSPQEIQSSSITLEATRTAKIYPIMDGSNPNTQMVHIQWECPPKQVCSAVVKPVEISSIENFSFNPNVMQRVMLTSLGNETYRVETVLESQPLN